MMASLPRAPVLCGRTLGRHTAAVELALVLAALASDPARIDARAAWFAGPLAPLVIPVGALPAAARSERLLAETRLGLGERVAIALAWGADASALRAAASHAGPLAGDPQLEAALQRWASITAAHLGISGEGLLAAVGSDGRARQASAEERGALADMQDLLSPLAWPRWRGPLLLVPYGLDHPAIAPGVARVVRPALPVLRPPPGGRAELAVAIAELALALSAPPATGWPDWLTSGIAGYGSGLAERALAERRHAAGAAAITQLFAGGGPVDATLATAVVGGLLHPRRRAHLGDLLDLLRHQAGSAGAVATAYGLTPEELAAGPEAAPPGR